MDQYIRKRYNAQLAHQFHQIAGKHIQNCKLACERMVSGVEYLKKNEQAFFAFGLANYAMLLQQGRGILGNIDLKDEYKEPILDDPKRTWFPFQLASSDECAKYTNRY